jgi:peptidoglycan/LPS O-acetylase OafA/YrhL
VARVNEPEYRPQLDALRFFAVLGVLVTHYFHFPVLPWIFGSFRGGYFEPGFVGVMLFFVLSGYLITGILLRCRDMADASGQGRKFFLQRFYVRRLLRIFPIYYLVLAAGFIANLPPAREIWMWLMTYTTNIYIVAQGEWVGSFGHFWTLAVEEQFYLMWPWLVLFLPRRWMIPTISGVICLGPLYRLLAVTINPTDYTSGMFTMNTLVFGSLDTLGLGALLALAHHSPATRANVHRLLTRVALPAGVVSYLLLNAAHYYGVSPWGLVVFGNTALGLIFCWLIAKAAQGFGGLPGRVLEWRPLVYFGKISYGIYVFHYFVPTALLFLFSQAGLSYRRSGPLNFVLASAITLLIASVSWRFFEQPINNLKRRFPYTPRATASKEAPVALGGAD